jgi:hypothetical protein
VLGRHLVNKNQDGITKLDKNIEHGGSYVRSVAEFLDSSLVKNDLSFEALLN